MEDLRIQHVDLQRKENLQEHHTSGFSSSKALVVRRGASFRISLQMEGPPLHPRRDRLILKVMLGRLFVVLPVSFSPRRSSRRWGAHCDPQAFDPRRPSISVWSPSSASVGRYSFHVHVRSSGGKKSSSTGRFTLLCNPWCPEDRVFLPFEDQREEYVQSDSGLLFMGTAKNPVSRPWSFDQFEVGVLGACLDLLMVSPLHKKNPRRDFLKRNDPVYISRLVSAMINSEDDRGVLKGNWTKNFKEGVNPSSWTGSGDILNQWSQSSYKPVKYGQCWVFAAVMCTVMRVLGIPCRVVTNFNSAHDTNANLVIEEFYSDTGKKLNHSLDSIWNFHVWVECWMERPDLTSDLNGWQVLDPTPQHRSSGVFCCGPAPVRGVRKQQVSLLYDVPFVFAEVNADVRTVIVSKGKVVGVATDTERVGSLICTKAVGYPRKHDITDDYKRRSRGPAASSPRWEESTLMRDSSVGVSLALEGSPVAGAPILFLVQVVNRQRALQTVRVHLTAQAKEYNHGPSEPFWEEHGLLHLQPMEVRLLKQQVAVVQYEEEVGEDVVNLSVVVEDTANQERALASEEFTMASPQLSIQIPDDDSVLLNKETSASISFTNPFSQSVSGVLAVGGAGLIQHKEHYRMASLAPGAAVEQTVTFTPSMGGVRMLQATLTFSSSHSAVRGFRMISVHSD